MKDYNVNVIDYVDYLKVLRNKVFKLLPLYEESNEHLSLYISDLSDRLIYLKNVIKELDDGYWYVEACSSLEELSDLIFNLTHGEVKRKVFFITSLITNEIDEIEKE